MHYNPAESFDDQLLVSYAFGSRFQSDGIFSLAKNPGYGYWLFAMSKLGLSVDVSQFLIWVAAAMACAFAFLTVFRRRWLAIVVYAYVLMNPIAFDDQLGTRVYRNSLFPPLLFLLLGLCILWIAYRTPIFGGSKLELRKSSQSSRSLVLCKTECLQYGFLGLLLGLFFLLLMILKEDSIWCIPIALLALCYKVVSVVRSRYDWKSVRKFVALSLVPLLVACGGLATVKAVNAHCFGVNLLNTRTEGEIAQFVSKVYSIDSGDQNDTLWAPKSSIESAFSASNTLSSNPKLLDNLEHYGFAYPDIDVSPLKGDFLTWQIRIAYDQTFGWHDEKSIQAFFSKANDEIDSAFESGELNKTSKKFLSGMLVPKHVVDAVLLLPQSLRFVWHSLTFDGFSYTVNTNGKSVDPTNLHEDEWNRLGIDVTNPEPSSALPFFNAQAVSVFLQRVYQVVNIALFGCCLFLFATRIIDRRKWGKGQVIVLIAILGLMLYALAYCFSTAWFVGFLADGRTLSEWNDVSFFYYACIAIPFIDVSLLTAFSLLAYRLAYLRCFYRKRRRHAGCDLDKAYSWYH